VRILLTGRHGQLGAELERALAPLGELTATGRETLDLAQLGAIKPAVAQLRPEVIVNAAAYTAVDRAERERETAFRINAHAVRLLGEAAAGCGALLVHYSTDYVFDGEKPQPYVEEDAPNPLSVYGESKLAGERALAACGCRHFVFRTSWVYGPRGRNFLGAILEAARAKPVLRVVEDQHGAPTSCHSIAEATARILAGGAGAPQGIYHMSAGGETTWHGFAAAILEEAGLATPVVPISSAEYGSAAPRPRNSRLDNAKLARSFGFALAPWREQLHAVMQAID